MGLRFRRRVKIAPGISVNFNKKSVSITTGVKGAHVTLNSKGKKTTTIGLPGTGLYYTKTSSSNSDIKKPINTSNRKPPKRKKSKIGKIAGMIIIMALLCGIVTAVQHIPDIDKSSNYNDIELLELDNHPHIYDSFTAAQEYYNSIETRRVRVVNIKEYSALQRKSEKDKVVLYLIKSSSDEDFIGELHINILDPEVQENMNLDKAVSLLALYLPNKFIAFYDKDETYKYGNDSTTIYVYSCRLNNKGIQYHNNGHPEFSFYYNFTISHKDNEWVLKTGYEALGGKGLEWINKYSQPWEIDLNKYLN